MLDLAALAALRILAPRRRRVKLGDGARPDQLCRNSCPQPGFPRTPLEQSLAASLAVLRTHVDGWVWNRPRRDDGNRSVNCVPAAAHRHAA
jgi:hypothetical protein